MIARAKSKEFIPSEYLEYLDNLKSKNINEETIEALKKNSPEVIAENVNAIFHDACKNTNLNLEELVNRLSFHPSDI